MNINNYRLETDKLIREYEVAIKSTPSVIKIFNDKMTKSILELINLESSYSNNHALAKDIKNCKVELEKRQRELTKEVNKDTKKGNGHKVVTGAKRIFGFMKKAHDIGEVPVDAVKKGFGLK